MLGIDDPRQYNLLTQEFTGRDQGHVTGVRTVTVDWSKPGEKTPFSEVSGSEKVWPADLVFLATGFVDPEPALAEMLGLETQKPQGNWKTIAAEHGPFATNVEGIFAAGDCRRGRSLVVWAINKGRGAGHRPVPDRQQHAPCPRDLPRPRRRDVGPASGWPHSMRNTTSEHACFLTVALVS